MRQELLRKAIEEAGQQKAISSAQIRHTLQACGRKKEGPHGLTFDLMRQLPEEGLSALTFLYHRIEATGLWPSSLHHVMIALLRKNEESERPIGLLSALYRLWGKMRADLVKRWRVIELLLNGVLLFLKPRG